MQVAVLRANNLARILHSTIFEHLGNKRPNCISLISKQDSLVCYISRAWWQNAKDTVWYTSTCWKYFTPPFHGHQQLLASCWKLNKVSPGKFLFTWLKIWFPNNKWRWALLLRRVHLPSSRSNLCTVEQCTFEVPYSFHPVQWALKLARSFRIHSQW